MAIVLPPELIKEILSWLPVKPLIRFKCLSKLFYSIIDSPDFIKMHLSKSIHTETHLNLILSNYDDDSIFAVDLDNGLQQVVQLSNPLRGPILKTYINGSCNGLLLLYKFYKYLALWNPFTRRYKKLPFCAIGSKARRELEGHFIGFGYDAASNDYKVVRIWVKLRPRVDFPIQVWVYSLSSNHWRRINDFPFAQCKILKQPARYANGVLYWQCDGGDKNRIIAFDVETESFSEISMPVYTLDDEREARLWVLGGCLCVNVSLTPSNTKTESYVWKKDDGWSLLFRAEKSEFDDDHQIEYGKALAYLKKGHRVLLDVNNGHNIAWYDMERKSCEWVDIDGAPDDFFPVVCLESLVSLGADSEFDGQIQGNN